MSDLAFCHAIHQPRLLKKVTAFDLNKSLLIMGFGTWGALEPGKLMQLLILIILASKFVIFWSFLIFFILIIETERDNADYVKDKLNKVLFLKMQAIENKKIKDQQDEKDSEKKKLADKKARNKKKSMPIDFEQKWKEQVCN